MLSIKKLSIPGYEQVVEATDPARGLHCYIAIHNTTLGPALGGTRMYPYASPQAALNDVLRLAKGMTYKSAVAEDGLGGGKSVIIGDSHKQKTTELLHAFAEVLDSFKGQYIAAEDVGTTLADMVTIRQRTPYVASLPGDRSSGDPSRYTAWGIFRGIQAVAKKLWHTKSLRGRSVAIQGLGSVGAKLASILFWEGANLIVTDIDPTVVHQMAHDYKASSISLDGIFSVPCDVFAPCALGGIINKTTLPFLKCSAIAGSANNQLENEEIGWELMQKGILYAPDYIINSGGIINAAAEFEPGGYNPVVARDRTNHIYDNLMKIFHKADADKKPTNLIANEIAEYHISHGIGKRKFPIQFNG
jgi:leucine dehydrogenase